MFFHGSLPVIFANLEKLSRNIAVYRYYGISISDGQFLIATSLDLYRKPVCNVNRPTDGANVSSIFTVWLLKKSNAAAAAAALSGYIGRYDNGLTAMIFYICCVVIEIISLYETLQLQGSYYYYAENSCET